MCMFVYLGCLLHKITAKQKNNIEYTSIVTDYDVDVGVWPGRGENYQISWILIWDQIDDTLVVIKCSQFDLKMGEGISWCFFLSFC